LDEAELVRQAVRGDADAFGELFERYANDVFRLALSMGHGRGEAEDLMQDTFLAAFESIGRFERRSAFKTWLLSILFRQAGRHRRYSRIRQTEVLDEGALSTGPNGVARAHRDGDHASRLDAHTMLDTLSPEHRAVLVLRELQGLSYDEIAQTLGVPRGTVESRLFRARNILRERFQGYSARGIGAPAELLRITVESSHE